MSEENKVDVVEEEKVTTEIKEENQVETTEEETVVETQEQISKTVDVTLTYANYGLQISAVVAYIPKNKAIHPSEIFEKISDDQVSGNREVVLRIKPELLECAVVELQSIGEEDEDGWRVIGERMREEIPGIPGGILMEAYEFGVADREFSFANGIEAVKVLKKYVHAPLNSNPTKNAPEKIKDRRIAAIEELLPILQDLKGEDKYGVPIKRDENKLEKPGDLHPQGTKAMCNLFSSFGMWPRDKDTVKRLFSLPIYLLGRVCQIQKPTGGPLVREADLEFMKDDDGNSLKPVFPEYDNPNGFFEGDYKDKEVPKFPEDLLLVVVGANEYPPRPPRKKRKPRKYKDRNATPNQDQQDKAAAARLRAEKEIENEWTTFWLKNTSETETAETAKTGEVVASTGQSASDASKDEEKADPWAKYGDMLNS